MLVLRGSIDGLIVRAYSVANIHVAKVQNKSWILFMLTKLTCLISVIARISYLKSCHCLNLVYHFLCLIMILNQNDGYTPW